MDTDPTDQEVVDTSDNRQAKRPRWSDDRTVETSDTKYDRSRWADWNKKEADDSNIPYTRVWEEPSVEKETKGAAWGTSLHYSPDWTAPAEVPESSMGGIERRV